MRPAELVLNYEALCDLNENVWTILRANVCSIQVTFFSRFLLHLILLREPIRARVPAGSLTRYSPPSWNIITSLTVTSCFARRNLTDHMEAGAEVHAHWHQLLEQKSCSSSTRTRLFTRRRPRRRSTRRPSTSRTFWAEARPRPARSRRRRLYRLRTRPSPVWFRPTGPRSTSPRRSTRFCPSTRSRPRTRPSTRSSAPWETLRTRWSVTTRWVRSQSFLSCLNLPMFLLLECYNERWPQNSSQKWRFCIAGRTSNVHGAVKVLLL